MKVADTVRATLFVASNLFLLSYQACKQAAESQPTCVISFDYRPPPPFLGFDCWGETGVVLFVLATGMIAGAIGFATNSDQFKTIEKRE